MARDDVNDDVMNTVCEAIASGKSLVSQLRALDISAGDFYVGLERNSAWAELYARAREVQADTLADEIVDIADDTAGDTDPASRRLRVEARKWTAAKLRPKRWGDNVNINHGGEVAHKVKLDMGALTADQLRALASITITETDK
jgi:hypothetical protein